MHASTTYTVDSHQHFWSLKRGDYNWLTPDLTALYKDFLPADYMAESANIAIGKTVLVQAAPSNEETDYMLKLASEHAFIGGVVGWVDFDGDPSVVCNRLDDLAANPWFKGIRPMLQDIPDPEWILTPAFSPIFEKLISLNLTFDALIKKEHIKHIVTLAETYSQLKIVIDHCAKPDIANDQFHAWAAEISYFKDLMNTFVKVSGLPTEANRSQQTPTSFQAYINHIHDVFGIERMMWGSDWPVVNINSSLGAWMTVVREHVKHLPTNEQDQLFRVTAEKFYTL